MTAPPVEIVDLRVVFRGRDRVAGEDVLAMDEARRARGALEGTRLEAIPGAPPEPVAVSPVHLARCLRTYALVAA